MAANRRASVRAASQKFVRVCMKTLTPNLLIYFGIIALYNIIIGIFLFNIRSSVQKVLCKVPASGSALVGGSPSDMRVTQGCAGCPDQLLMCGKPMCYQAAMNLTYQANASSSTNNLFKIFEIASQSDVCNELHKISDSPVQMFELMMTAIENDATKRTALEQCLNYQCGVLANIFGPSNKDLFDSSGKCENVWGTKPRWLSTDCVCARTRVDSRVASMIRSACGTTLAFILEIPYHQALMFDKEVKEKEVLQITQNKYPGIFSRFVRTSACVSLTVDNTFLNMIEQAANNQAAASNTATGTAAVASYPEDCEKFWCHAANETIFHWNWTHDAELSSMSRDRLAGYSTLCNKMYTLWTNTYNVVRFVCWKAVKTPSWFSPPAICRTSAYQWVIDCPTTKCPMDARTNDTVLLGCMVCQLPGGFRLVPEMRPLCFENQRRAREGCGGQRRLNLPASGNSSADYGGLVLGVGLITKDADMDSTGSHDSHNREDALEMRIRSSCEEKPPQEAEKRSNLSQLPVRSVGAFETGPLQLSLLELGEWRYQELADTGPMARNETQGIVRSLQEADGAAAEAGGGSAQMNDVLDDYDVGPFSRCTCYQQCIPGVKVRNVVCNSRACKDPKPKTQVTCMCNHCADCDYEPGMLILSIGFFAEGALSLLVSLAWLKITALTEDDMAEVGCCLGLLGFFCKFMPALMRIVTLFNIGMIAYMAFISLIPISGFQYDCNFVFDLQLSVIVAIFSWFLCLALAIVTKAKQPVPPWLYQTPGGGLIRLICKPIRAVGP